MTPIARAKLPALNADGAEPRTLVPAGAPIPSVLPLVRRHQIRT
jgi:hypothetical protein